MRRKNTPQDAYQKGYIDGSRMAEQMRWQGTPIGNVLKGSCYEPDADFSAAYDDGFAHAMDGASRVEWGLLKEKKDRYEARGGVESRQWLSVA